MNILLNLPRYLLLAVLFIGGPLGLLISVPKQGYEVGLSSGAFWGFFLVTLLMTWLFYKALKGNILKPSKKLSSSVSNAQSIVEKNLNEAKAAISNNVNKAIAEADEAKVQTAKRKTFIDLVNARSSTKALPVTILGRLCITLSVVCLT